MSYNFEPEFKELLQHLPPFEANDPEDIASARASLAEMVVPSTTTLTGTTGLPSVSHGMRPVVSGPGARTWYEATLSG